MVPASSQREPLHNEKKNQPLLEEVTFPPIPTASVFLRKNIFRKIDHHHHTTPPPPPPSHPTHTPPTLSSRTLQGKLAFPVERCVQYKTRHGTVRFTISSVKNRSINAVEQLFSFPPPRISGGIFFRKIAPGVKERN